MIEQRGSELCGFLSEILASFRFASFGHITADKREIKDFPKLPSETSFIRKTLYEIVAIFFNVNPRRRNKNKKGYECKNVPPHHL